MAPISEADMSHSRSTVAFLSSNLNNTSALSVPESWNCRSACWCGHTRRSTALASVSIVSARLGQPRRRQSSNSARHIRLAFCEMYDPSATSENASHRTRLMYTCSSKLTLPTRSAIVALVISIGHARFRSARSVSSSGISSSRGAMVSNSSACATMCRMSGICMFGVKCLSNVSMLLTLM